VEAGVHDTEVEAPEQILTRAAPGGRRGRAQAGADLAAAGG
jgi:hypothetical protein